MQVALSLLMVIGMMILPYLDDWLLCTYTYELVIWNTFTHSKAELKVVHLPLKFHLGVLRSSLPVGKLTQCCDS